MTHEEAKTKYPDDFEKMVREEAVDIMTSAKRVRYAFALEEAEYLIIEWFKTAKEIYWLNPTDPESIARFVAAHKRPYVWAVFMALSN